MLTYAVLLIPENAVTPANALAHRNISEKRCAWIRSSPSVGRCCLREAQGYHTQTLQRTVASVKRQAGKPKLH